MTRVINSRGRVHAPGKSMFHNGEYPKADNSFMTEAEIMGNMADFAQPQPSNRQPALRRELPPEMLDTFPTQADLDRMNDD